jgi:hypothetical protein
MDVIYISNANVVEISSLTNGATDVLVGSATVRCTLKDSAGVNVTGATGLTWPITMAAVTGATGTYRGTLPYTLSLATGTYTATITADGGGDLYGTWQVPVRAVIRTGGA